MPSSCCLAPAGLLDPPGLLGPPAPPGLPAPRGAPGVATASRSVERLKYIELTLPPIETTALRIATETTPAIKPYSNEVAPPSSLTNRERVCFTTPVFRRYLAHMLTS